MSTDVTPPASAELTELGKCLMKQEVRHGELLAASPPYLFPKLPAVGIFNLSHSHFVSEFFVLASKQQQLVSVGWGCFGAYSNPLAFAAGSLLAAALTG